MVASTGYTERERLKLLIYLLSSVSGIVLLPWQGPQLVGTVQWHPQGDS